MSSTHTLHGAMQDARFVTNYRPICEAQARVAREQKIPSWNSTKYRAYIQQKGLGLINSSFHASPCGAQACADFGVTGPTKAVSPPYVEGNGDEVVGISASHAASMNM